MKTTKEQRAELRARTPTSQQSMYQLYVRRAELHAVLDDLDEAEARAERLLHEVNESLDVLASHVKHENERSADRFHAGCEFAFRESIAEMRAALAETEKEKP